MQGAGVVLNLHAHLSFGGSLRKPPPSPSRANRPRNDAVSTPSIFFHTKSRFVSRCVEEKTKFVEVFEVLKWELLNDPAFQWTNTSRQWVDKMMDYNVPRGKLSRGQLVIRCYNSLKDGENASDEEAFFASVLGWCIEWLQASYFIHDDIINTAETRRGQPSWYKNPKVGKIAIIDGVTLQSQVYRILKKHFGEKSYYMDLLHLFSEVEYQLLCFRHDNIARYQTSHYSLYLPVACALLLAGEKLEKHMNVRDVLLDMGIYFQVLDDYYNCFGDPSVTGKSGTDIETFKCSWLLLQALELCNEQQKKILLEHYTKSDSIDVAKVKSVYNEIDIHSAFISYKGKSYDKLRRRVESHPSKALKAVWKLCEEASMF